MNIIIGRSIGCRNGVRENVRRVKRREAFTLILYFKIWIYKLTRFKMVASILKDRTVKINHEFF